MIRPHESSHYERLELPAGTGDNPPLTRKGCRFRRVSSQAIYTGVGRAGGAGVFAGPMRCAVSLDYPFAKTQRTEPRQGPTAADPTANGSDH